MTIFEKIPLLEPLFAEKAAASLVQKAQLSVPDLQIALGEQLRNTQVPASWDPSRKTIFLSPLLKTLEDMAAALIFELVNVSADNRFRRLDESAKENLLTKSEYVEAVEYEEFQTAKKTEELVHTLFPKRPKPLRLSQFADHYRYQQLCGHSARIAKQYDRLNKSKSSYHGTWPTPVTAAQVPYLKKALIWKQKGKVSEIEQLIKAVQQQQPLVENLSAILNSALSNSSISEIVL